MRLPVMFAVIGLLAAAIEIPPVPSAQAGTSATPATPSAAGIAKCPPAWSFLPFVPAPGAPATPNLVVVSGTEPTDAWGVGDSNGAALILHFDGSAWTLPKQPLLQGFLETVAAISPADAWAAGYRYAGRGTRTLLEHWDGGRWQRVTDAAASFPQAEIQRLTTDVDGDTWALGSAETAHGARLTFVERWDGTSWALVGTPAEATQISAGDISALSSNDAWIVGSLREGGTLAEHWDGSAWTIVPTPNIGHFEATNALSAIAAASSTDVWAFGRSGLYHRPPLIEHWNGLRWSVIQAERYPRKTALTSALAVSGSDVWATGETSRGSTYLEHWDGRSWQEVESIFVRGRPIFLGALGWAGPGQIWAGAGARICPIVLTDTGMKPRYADTTSPIPLRPIRVPSFVPRTVVWRVDPLAGQAVEIEELSLGLFDSGVLLPGDTFSYTFDAAGTYQVLQLPSGKIGSVGIPLRIRPPRGNSDQAFHLTWGGGPTDVQVKPPGGDTFLMWQRRTLDSGADFDSLDPLWAGPGVYEFRARVHSQTTPSVSEWSPVVSITVR